MLFLCGADLGSQSSRASSQPRAAASCIPPARRREVTTAGLPRQTERRGVAQQAHARLAVIGAGGEPANGDGRQQKQFVRGQNSSMRARNSCVALAQCGDFGRRRCVRPTPGARGSRAESDRSGRHECARLPMPGWARRSRRNRATSRRRSVARAAQRLQARESRHAMRRQSPARNRAEKAVVDVRRSG